MNVTLTRQKNSMAKRNNIFTRDQIEEANRFLIEDRYEEFFNVFGFSVHEDPDENEMEIEAYTDGGVDMFATIDRSKWKESFREYASNFDVDEEIRIMRQDPNGSYCSDFTTEQSAADYGEWKRWIEEIATLILRDGEYRYIEETGCTDFGPLHVDGDRIKVLLFPKDKYEKGTLDKMSHRDLYKEFLFNPLTVHRFETVWKYQNNVNDDCGLDAAGYYVYFVIAE